MSLQLDVVAAVILHMCPFSYHGDQYLTIPMTELRDVADEINKHSFLHQFDAEMGLIVKPTTSGCKPDDGANVPGLL